MPRSPRRRSQGAGADPSSIRRVGQAEFLPAFYASWQLGQHVSLIGPTGKGKTNLLLNILPRRTARVVMVSKPEDKTLAGLTKTEGYRRIDKWPPPADQYQLLLWPKIKEMHMMAGQASTFRAALHSIYRTGRWCIAADDLNYLCQQLKLQKELELIWLNGRSIGISLVACAQRPASVPLLAYSMPTHLFLFRTRDEPDIKRLGGMNGVDSDMVKDTVMQLDAEAHEVLYVNTETSDMAIVTVERHTV